jgi:cell division septum initiation protein DivIVA
VKAENAAVRELLRKMEEQQRVLLEQVERLEQRLDGGAAANASKALKPIVSSSTADAVAPASNDASTNALPVADSATTSAPPVQGNDERYRDGILSGKLGRTLRFRSC